MAGELKRLNDYYYCRYPHAEHADVLTALDLLGRAASIMENDLPTKAMTKWLAEYRAAKGE